MLRAFRSNSRVNLFINSTMGDRRIRSRRLGDGMRTARPATSSCIRCPVRSVSARKRPSEIRKASTTASPASMWQLMPAFSRDSSHSAVLMPEDAATSMISSGRCGGSRPCTRALRSSSRRFHVVLKVPLRSVMELKNARSSSSSAGSPAALPCAAKYNSKAVGIGVLMAMSGGIDQPLHLVGEAGDHRFDGE